MIEYTYEIENNDEYKKFSYFEISDNLKELLDANYYKYSVDIDKMDNAIKLYDKNFTNKYDRQTQSEIFQLYIDNQAFKEKVIFIYNVIDEKKYKNFVENNSEINNPNDMWIKYSTIDSEGTKVLIYNITLQDISFVF